MDNKSYQIFEDINRKLGVVIALLAQPIDPDQKQTLAERIVMLSKFGLRTGEIATILGKTTSHVSKELSLAQGGKKK